MVCAIVAVSARVGGGGFGRWLALGDDFGAGDVDCRCFEFAPFGDFLRGWYSLEGLCHVCLLPKAAL